MKATLSLPPRYQTASSIASAMAEPVASATFGVWVRGLVIDSGVGR